MKNRNLFKRINRVVVLCTLSLMFSISGIMAQPSDPGVDPGDVPIDGGLSLLIAVGVGYGTKKIVEQNKKARKKTTDMI